MLRLRTALALVIVLATVPPLASAGALSRGLTARLRPQSSRVTAWLDYGLSRSPSMRALAERVERSDVFVYVTLDRTLASGVSACVTWVASAQGARYVRVSLRPDLRFTDGAAMLAHELQHVVEVIEHPDVQSGDDLAALYRRIGHRTSPTASAWDTVAALRAGSQAKAEFSSGV